IALLAVDRDMSVAQRVKSLEGKKLVGALRLLQAQDVGRALGKQALDQRQAQANRIDVPGGDGKRHGQNRPEGLSPPASREIERQPPAVEISGRRSSSPCRAWRNRS